jgi:hypothetical protein
MPVKIPQSVMESMMLHARSLTSWEEIPQLLQFSYEQGFVEGSKRARVWPKGAGSIVEGQQRYAEIMREERERQWHEDQYESMSRLVTALNLVREQETWKGLTIARQTALGYQLLELPLSEHKPMIAAIERLTSEERTDLLLNMADLAAASMRKAAYR